MKIALIGRRTTSARVMEEETAEARPAARVSLSGADRDNAAGWLDAATGGEFLDDRIRLIEPGDDEWHNER